MYTPSSKAIKRALRRREIVDIVDKWMVANEAFNFPLTVQIKEKYKVIKEKHEEEGDVVVLQVKKVGHVVEEDGLADKEKSVTADDVERDLVDSIIDLTEEKVSSNQVKTPITKNVDEALEVTSIELNIAPVASEAFFEGEQIPAGEKKRDRLEGEPSTVVEEIGELKCNKQVDLMSNRDCLKISAKNPLGLLSLLDEETTFPNDSPKLLKNNYDANLTGSSIL